MFVEGGHKFDDSTKFVEEWASCPPLRPHVAHHRLLQRVVAKVVMLSQMIPKAALLKSRIKGIDSNGSVHNNRVDLRKPSRRRTGGKKNGGLCLIS